MSLQNQVDFEAVLEETQSHIRAYIAGMGVASHEVDDVAQDTYIEFFKNLHKIPAEVAPSRWLKGIARNLCLNHFRKRARRGRLHREALAELLSRLESSFAEKGIDGSLDDALERCTDQLTDRSRKLLVLKYRDELSSDSMAKAMKSTAQAVRVSLHRIRASLRDCISDTLAVEGA